MTTKKTKEESTISLEKLEREVAAAKAAYDESQAQLKKAKRRAAEREAKKWSEQLILKTLCFKKDLTVDEIVAALTIVVERKNGEVRQ